MLAVSAALFLLAFPPLPTGVLAWLFLVPFLMLLERRGFTGGFRFGLILGLACNGGLLFWMSLNNGASLAQALGMHLALTAYLAVGWGAFGFLAAASLRRFGLLGLVAVPFLWTAMEYAYSFGDLAFPWTSLATTQTYYPDLIQFVGITGMYGVPLWVAGINVLVFLVWRRRRRPEAAGLVFTILVPLLGGYLAMPREGEAPERSIRVAAIQPAVDSTRKFEERELAWIELMRMTMALDRGPYDLVVWPETATPIQLRDDGPRLSQLRAVLAGKQAALLTGSLTRVRKEGQEDGDAAGDEESETRAERVKGKSYRTRNSLLLVRPDIVRLEIYDKLFLVPFGETVPRYLWFLEDLMLDAGSGSMIPGQGVKLLEVPLFDGGRVTGAVPVAGLICLEGIHPRLVSRFVDAGADLLVIVTNDAWYDGTTEPVQHARIAVLRAIEHRISVVRCANSGISAVIDPHGRVRQATPGGTRAVLEAAVEIGRERTFYSRFGDWLPIPVSILAALFSLFLLLEPRLRRREAT
jgi:apolipoprotein N-acyltransferase